MRRPVFNARAAHGGFTLIEAIMVITITGILFTAVAFFIRLPVAGAVDTARRAAMTDTADLALRRMRREIQSALPNSVRVQTDAVGRVFIEFLPVLGGGRYCAENCLDAGGVAIDPLSFDAADAAFKVVGPFIAQPGLTPTGTRLAIFNLGIEGADAYRGDNTSPISAISTAGAVTQISFTSRLFPFESPGNRFHIIGAPVTYICTKGSSGANGTGTLTRYTGYATQATQPATLAAFSGVAGRLLAERLAECEANYTQALTDRYGLIGITLQLKQENEIATLTHQIQVNNAP